MGTIKKTGCLGGDETTLGTGPRRLDDPGAVEPAGLADPILVKFDRAQLDELTELAEARGVSRMSLIREALDDLLTIKYGRET